MANARCSPYVLVMSHSPEMSGRRESLFLLPQASNKAGQASGDRRAYLRLGGSLLLKLPSLQRSDCAMLLIVSCLPKGLPRFLFRVMAGTFHVDGQHICWTKYAAIAVSWVRTRQYAEEATSTGHTSA